MSKDRGQKGAKKPAQLTLKEKRAAKREKVASDATELSKRR